MIIPEQFKTDHEKTFYIKAKIEEFRAAMSFAQTALKISILINGGGAIAILAFLGNTWSKNNVTADLTESLSFFAYGIIAAAVGSGVAYLTQCNYLMAENKKQQKRAAWGRVAAITCIIISYVFFMFGAWGASSAFSDLKKLKSTSCTCGEAVDGSS